MAKSAALNPASMPFFPGALRASADDDRALSGLVTFGQAQHGVDPSVVSDYLSARSTPSPPSSSQEVRQQSPLQPDKDRRSPAIRQSDAVKPYPGIESRVFREGSMVGTLGTLPEKDEGPYAEDEHIAQSPPSSYRQQQPSEQALPVGLGSLGRSLSVATLSSASPVSLSNDSNSRATPILDPFEAQLRASPLFHDILDRLVRCELVSREIQRDMSDLNRKVNILIERSVLNNNQPEFKDPFASSPVNPLQQRPSMGNIAPNQAASTDDTSSISQRLNTLTSSVGQLLALQTQQIQHQQQQQQNISPAESRSSIIGLGNTNPQLDISPNHILSPSGLVNAAMLSHLPNRPQDMRSASRPQNPSVRMWSSGSLELPVRPGQDLGRQDSMLRDKRRSSGLLRRDSAGVFEPQGDLLSGNGIRDNGPMVTKWDQLNLAPELLRSLSKFGVGPPNKIQQRALPFLLRGSDIIAQAPPTQERIAAYVIPAIQVAFAHMATRRNRGPIVIMVSTTLDQATQAQRMIRDLGGPIGVKSALGVGITPVNSELLQEIRVLQQNVPHIICGTPQKLHALFTTPGGLSGSEVRFLVLDEVDQLIARNLHEFVFNIVKLLPPPRSRPSTSITPGGSSTPIPGASATINSPFEQGNVMSALQPSGRRFSAAVPSPTPPLDGVSPTSSSSVNQVVIERQTALFSNTVPQDVLNLASAIHLREPVRVLVRRDGNVSNTETNPSARGLRQFYLYLAFQAGGRGDPMASSAAAGGGGLGIIGSGRSSSSAETTQAREWKLDALADLLDDVEVNHAVVHVGGMTALDAVVYKLASRGFEPIPLHGDMNSVTRVSALNKFRTASTILRQPSMKALVVYDVLLKGGETPHIPLVINYDLPKAVEEYSQRVAPAMASNYSRAGVVINFVTATGGDVEMLRSIECFYKIKCPEVPMSLRDIV